MRQILLIGFSTTGKSTLIKKLSPDFPHRKFLDTDNEISKDFHESISNIYYSLKEKTHDYIKKRESEILIQLKSSPDNLIIAAGPGIPLNDFYKDYVKNKKPHVVLISKPADKIYESLLERRAEMRNKVENQRSDFGIWDIDVMVDQNLNEYPKEVAIEKIQTHLNQRQNQYNEYATIFINTSDIFAPKLPQTLLDIL